jgi:hypothetical protein
MTLLVEAPAAREPERRYILDVVLGDWLGLAWELRTADRADVRLSVAGDGDGDDERAVLVPDVLLATRPQDWLTEASLPAVRWAGGLPVLYGSGPDAPAAAPARLEVDVFGSAFFMLTRYEELVLRERDRYGRFPAAASVAGRAGLLRTPIVDAYAELLWAALQRTWPRLSRAPRRYEVVLSHDVDDPLATLEHGPGDVVRQLGGDLVRRRDPRLAVRRIRSLAGDPRNDPNNTFDFLMDVSERHGLRSAFYFLAHREQHPRRDGAYLFEAPWVRGLIAGIARRGHEIGVHPSFGTYRDPARIGEELGRLRRVAEAAGARQEEWGGRQHFLRWANPATWRAWEQAGLSYDSTVAYADAVGFRAGTCRPYRAFDLQARRPLRLVERPLAVMDVALLPEAGGSLDAAAQVVLDLAASCRRHGGCLTILWHNNTLLRSAREQRWYAELIAAVSG